jgi:hypothetical protein
MTDDTDWESLKASWQATPLSMIAADSLRWGLRWRSIGSWIYLGIEVGGVALMAVIVALQWTAGARGAAVAVALLTGVCASASIWARRTASYGSLASVVGMLDLSIAKTSRSIRLAMASYVMTMACVVYVGFMYFSTMAPAGVRGDEERAVLALSLLVAYAAGTALYHYYGLRRRQRLITLRSMVAGGGTNFLEADAWERR